MTSFRESVLGKLLLRSRYRNLWYLTRCSSLKEVKSNSSKLKRGRNMDCSRNPGCLMELNEKNSPRPVERKRGDQKGVRNPENNSFKLFLSGHLISPASF
jgi:hypothetical protein